MVVDDELLAKAVVPQAEHDIDHHLPHHVLAHDHRAGHAHMMIGVTPIHQRRQRQVDRCTAFGGKTPHAFTNGADVQRVGRAGQMLPMQLGAADRDEDNIILLAVGFHLPAGGGLDIGTGLAPLDRGGDAIISQDGIDLLIAGIPDLFLHPTNRVIFKKQVGLVSSQESFGYMRIRHKSTPLFT